MSKVWINGIEVLGDLVYFEGVTVPNPKPPRTTIELGSGRFEITGQLAVRFFDEELYEAILEGEERLRELCEARVMSAMRTSLLRLIERKPR